MGFYIGISLYLYLKCSPSISWNYLKTSWKIFSISPPPFSPAPHNWWTTPKFVSHIISLQCNQIPPLLRTACFPTCRISVNLLSKFIMCDFLEFKFHLYLSWLEANSFNRPSSLKLVEFLFDKLPRETRGKQWKQTALSLQRRCLCFRLAYLLKTKLPIFILHLGY